MNLAIGLTLGACAVVYFRIAPALKRKRKLDKIKRERRNK